MLVGLCSEDSAYQELMAEMGTLQVGGGQLLGSWGRHCVTAHPI